MDEVDEYRKHAASLLKLATRANSNKRRLLLMPEAWLHLADKASRLARQLETTQRLVREAFSENRGR
jgi:hypothetical protein